MVSARAWWVLVVPVLLALVLCSVWPSSAEVPPTQGCTEVEATELHVHQAYACGDGTRVLTFSDVTARDAYTQVATYFGVTVVDKGERWIRIRGV